MGTTIQEQQFHDLVAMFFVRIGIATDEREQETTRRFAQGQARRLQREIEIEAKRLDAVCQDVFHELYKERNNNE